MTVKPVVLSLRHFSIVLLILGVAVALLAFARLSGSSGVVNILMLGLGVIAAMFGLQSIQTRQGVTVIGATQRYFNAMTAETLESHGLAQSYRAGRGFAVIRHCYTHKRTVDAKSADLLASMKAYTQSKPQQLSLHPGSNPADQSTDRAFIAACAATLAVILVLLAWLLQIG